MIKKALTIGDARLLQVSEKIKDSEFNTPYLNNIITDMKDTMRHLGGVGIAAIQIGYNKRICLIEYDGANTRYPIMKELPLTVVINPELTIIGTECCVYNEGCLSVPSMRAIISRAKHIQYKFYTQTHELITGVDEGFFARVLMHEVDHMDGILYPMRINVAETFIINNEKKEV